MMTRYSAWLDGLPLHEIDPAIYILDIQEDPAQVDVSTAAKAGSHGRFMVAQKRQTLSVTILFAIREKDVVARKAIMQKIVGWAKNGKYLSINDRPGQRLRVHADNLPTIPSSLKWTQEISLTLTAYGNPFWESEAEEILTTSATASMTVPGDGYQAYVNATIEPTGGTVTLFVDGTTMTLQNVSDLVEISHDDDGILRIVSNGESILSKRTAESDDDLLATPGRVNVFTVDGGTATFRVRGVWA